MDETELRINLKALKNIDPYIIDIEEHSSQVALYKYQSKTGEWEKTEVEGTLFVYRRAAEPLYGFTIMNRLSMKNLVEPVTKQLDFQLQAPFLLYRNHQVF
jgi:mRNA-decapping enzyme 1B